MPSIFSQEDKKRIRTQLLAEGREMMLGRGITKMNIDELAESAGIAKGTFYNFFPSKQDFIMEIIHSYQNEKLAQLEKLAADKKGKLTLDETFEWYKTLHQPKENPLYHISKKDKDWILTKIPPERLFRPEVNIRTGKLILSMTEGVREDIDYRVLANFPKMMALAIENKDFMHKEALETNFQMIVDCMYRYVKGEN
ncbi:MAG: TetR/AcrR family transcriptional regulator [Lachnospiraceae bacterium]|nr:TetR/AcrR family transcriptional regulator [Lachnospiraceae bacterium]